MTTWQDAFALQTQACRMLGSGLTARVCEALTRIIAADTGPVGQRVKTWPGDPGPGGDSVPLRLCGGLHALVLSDQAPGLVKAYNAGGGMHLDQEIRTAIQSHARHILDWLELAPQTNEVARSGPLIAAAWFLAGQLPERRFDLLELGASAGLNLNFPHYSLATQDGFQPTLSGDSGAEVRLVPRWQGQAPRPHPLQVVAARGVDLNPLDPDREVFRLMAYVWADQRDRLGRLRAALALARAIPPRVDQGDAAEWLAARLAEPAEHGRLVYHTIAAQYFPDETREQIGQSLQEAGARADATRPLAHVSMEADGRDGAALDLRLWAGGAMRRWRLGRADFHGRWIDWQPEEAS
ncbi:hypothetical protein SAMN04487972_11435 [Paracoccus halophilus]|uniref:DUF2332 domain-containing protein n=1 Tax=Paracoccus halophilus TaxID=376733 RepID=A0A099F1W2_9RHOB|nr:DUF2332 domain-containing protein [Paracoccus halophilus]KGJ04142.1 hypothetical protein IT41_11575 [Paracoccus halophilus]SFA55789.1 hypothetical protein SAMN04487972_11435 [Paracoccus halophilus]